MAAIRAWSCLPVLDGSVRIYSDSKCYFGDVLYFSSLVIYKLITVVLGYFFSALDRQTETIDKMVPVAIVCKNISAFDAPGDDVV